MNGGRAMKWFQRDREERPAGVVPLSGVVKSESAPGQAPPPLAAGGPVLQRIGGHSDQVARMTTPAEPVILDITHQGRGHFVVDALDAGLHSQSQLVYTDGPFACRALVNADDRTVRALRVQADGPWAIEATAVSSAAALDGAARCPASNVLRYEGGPGIASLCHEETRGPRTAATSSSTPTQRMGTVSSTSWPTTSAPGGARHR